MDRLLKHNLEHNGLWNSNQWIGFRFDTHDYGVVEVFERNPGYPDKWYWRTYPDPDLHVEGYSISTNELLERYATQLERFVLKLQQELS